MNDHAQAAPLLSVVTVVRNDLPGLLRTLESVQSRLGDALMAGEVEHIVIDGSTNADIRDHLHAHPAAHRRWVSESDQGIYDAMNKGLTRSVARYSLFMNAGDIFSIGFNWSALRPHLLSESRVLIAYAMECFAGDRYLRPGAGRERNAFEGPPHQATFYPKAFYASERYRLDLPVAADGEYTQRALGQLGGVFVPVVVAEFALGGVSSHYGRWVVLKRRMAEQDGWRGCAKLVFKFALWRLVSQRVFYRLLAAGKYTRLQVGEVPRLRGGTLSFPGGRAG